MKLRSAALAALVALCLQADPRVTKVRNVYILPMSGGMDQYLANRLVESGRYQVVTDPAQAEALLTDQIGEVLDQRITELYPPPAPPKPPEEKNEPVDDRIGMALSETKTTRPQSSFSRGRGNVFLIERSSRQVLWSTFLRPRNTMPDELDAVAGEVVGRLNDAAKAEIKRIRKEEEAAAKAMRETVVVAAPATVQPAPAPVQTAPTPPQPAPTAVQPAPATTQPAPAPVQAAPTPAQPAPVAAQPAPATTQPKPPPVQTAPAPAQPAPAAAQPAPATTQPPPAAAPAKPTPAPAPAK